MQCLILNICAVMVLTLTSFCHAAPEELGRINIELYGEVVVSTCGVLQNEQNKYINLGRYASNDLVRVGDKTPAVPIQFSLSHCLPGLPVTLTFSGTKDRLDTELLAIEQGSQAAQNIAIEILDQDKKRLALGQKSQGLIADQAGNISSLFYANYIVTQANATAGAANANAQFIVQYD